MKTTTETLLKAWNDATDAFRNANSKVACATALFLAGKLGREELAHYSAQAEAATTARDAAERAYRNSYRNAA
jgi:hypothetical protein